MNLAEIEKMRVEVTEELILFLTKAKSEFTLEDIKEMIYEEEEHEDFQHLLTLFDDGQGVAELSTIIELLQDAWNYFPHKTLGGISPAEFLLKSEKRN